MLDADGTAIDASPPRVHNGQFQSLSGTSVSGGFKHDMCQPRKHVSHSSMTRSGSGASPHFVHGTSSSSSKSSVLSLTTYTESPTEKMTPSKFTIFQYLRLGAAEAAEAFLPLVFFTVWDATVSAVDVVVGVAAAAETVVVVEDFAYAFAAFAAFAAAAAAEAALDAFPALPFFIVAFAAAAAVAATCAALLFSRAANTAANAFPSIFGFFFFFPSMDVVVVVVAAPSPALVRFTGRSPSSVAYVRNLGFVPSRSPPACAPCVACVRVDARVRRPLIHDALMESNQIKSNQVALVVVHRASRRPND